MSRTPSPLVIIGAGGMARDLVDVVEAMNEVRPTYDLLGYIVDARYGTPGDSVNERPILGGFEWLTDHPAVSAICGVGAPEHRRQLVERATAAGVSFGTAIHPSAVLTRRVTLGVGIVITAGCVLTNQITIGDHVLVNLGCTIAHDAVLDNFVTLAPGVHVSGNVRLAEGCNIGTGASIVEKRTIGAWSVVGAGSAIIRDVEPNTVVVGVPGAVKSTRDAGWHLG